MNIVLLRVGIDTGCGGIHSPLFSDGTFEFVPIPDGRGLDERTYGNSKGGIGRVFAEYFPQRKQEEAKLQSMHVDPEFDSFTYGDPTPPKRGLAKMNAGDLLVFYAGMEGWGHAKLPALYLVGMFKVELVGFAEKFPHKQLRKEFGENFHVRHKEVFSIDREKLVLIKGGSGSRLFLRAHLLGERRFRREKGTWWQFITPEMEKIFGHFGGIGSLQRSTPRWVDEEFIGKAKKFLDSLE